MKAYIILALIAFSNCIYTEKEAFGLFQSFLFKYNKHYSSLEEYMHRFHSFQSNLNIVFQKNDDYQEGITKFFDLTPAEFNEKYLNFRPILQNGKPHHVPPMPNPPEEWNWMDHGVLGEVRDQRSCGSCWAFATCGNLEGCWNNKYKPTPLETCSEQMLVDCDKYDEGCNGGDFNTSMKWIIENGGIMRNEDYEYEAFQGECRQDKTKLHIKITDFKFLSNENEEEMQDWLLKYGPLAIGLNAQMMQFYMGGIITPRPGQCSGAPEKINHGVVLVGYGKTDEKRFWIARNSWGGNWGEEGYFRIVRGAGACGLNKMVYTGIVA